ncbi:MAG: RNA polymerase sigma factor RpoH [Pseudomonadales bacterium]|nr:RNA polymerase sigma factor RpoH [Pseudomonadales bacterium]
MSKDIQVLPSLTPGADLNAYMTSVSAIPVLSVDEERDLAEAYYYQDDLNAARQLVLSHLRFVVHIAKSYNGYGLPVADLVQEGNVGLMKAIKRYNPEKGVRLVSFAVHWIKAEMHEFILRNWRIVKIATTKAQRKLFFNLRSQKKRLAWLSQDEAKAIADDLGVDIKDVQSMEGRLTASDMAFDLSADDDDEAPVHAPVQFLEDHSQDPATLAEQNDWQETANIGLYRALESLDQRSREILQRRWLDENKATLHDLAAEYGISAERIRQLEKQAMGKIKANMAV